MSQKYSATSEIDKSINIAVEVNQDKYMVQLGSLMNTAYYVAKAGLSFLKYTEICELQIKNGSQMDLGENYLTDVACMRLISSIAEDTKSDLKSDVANARFLAVLSDGSTDVGILEEEAVYLRYTLLILRIRLKVMQWEFSKPLQTF